MSLKNLPCTCTVMALTGSTIPIKSYVSVFLLLIIAIALSEMDFSHYTWEMVFTKAGVPQDSPTVQT